MAQYKYSTFLQQKDLGAYDEKLPPGTETSNAGIYRCSGCGKEIGIAKGHKLPAQNHHQHGTSEGDILWQLIVFAQG